MSASSPAPSVLTVIAQMAAGGAEAVAAELSRAVLRQGGRVRLASGGGWRADQLSADGVTLVPLRLDGRRPNDLAASVLALHGALRREPAELVHVHNVKAAAVTGTALRALPARGRPPVLVTLHGVPDGSYGRAARTLGRVADRVAAVSADVAERVVTAGLPGARVEVIENAVRPLPRHGRDAARAALGLDPEIPVLLCLARLVRQKRHDLLLAAVDRLPFDVQLLIAGDGPTRPEISAAIAGLGMQQRVRMLGERRDPEVLLAAADALVLPSDWEGLPISVLEAMSLDVPVIASAVGALPDLLEGAVHLVAPGSIPALTAGIRTVLENPARCAELTDAGRHLLADRFGLPTMIARYRSAYAALAGSSLPGSPHGPASPTALTKEDL